MSLVAPSPAVYRLHVGFSSKDNKRGIGFETRELEAPSDEAAIRAAQTMLNVPPDLVLNLAILQDAATHIIWSHDTAGSN